MSFGRRGGMPPSSAYPRGYFTPSYPSYMPDRSGSASPRDRNSAKGKRRNGDRQGKQPNKAATKPPRAERSGWGSVAQHGAAGATHGQRLSDEEGPREFSKDERERFQVRQARRDKAAERVDGLRNEARAAIDRSGGEASLASAPKVGDKPTVARRPLPGRPPQPLDIHRELVNAHGKDKGDRSWRLYRRAAREFETDELDDARRTMKPLIDSNSRIVDLRELYGIILYRLGKWELAIEQLEQFREGAGTVEQNPVLMDAHRALSHWADVDELWKELAEASPSAELTIEGRIVRAGAEADRGDLSSAIRILEKGWKTPKNPQEHHLRRAYVLADLFERHGKIPRARSLFEWLASTEPPYGDAAERAQGLY